MRRKTMMRNRANSNSASMLYDNCPGACLKKAFCKMYVTICGRFCPIKGGVEGYANRKKTKYTAKWGVQIAGMIF